MSASINPETSAIPPPKPLEAPKRAKVPAFGVPDDILSDPDLIEAMKVLPSNYNFEVPKTIWKVREANAKLVALQLPEGLQIFATTLADIVERFTGAATVVMGDVTFGACCIDDLGAASLGVDFMVHYGHSCLVPIDVTSSSGVKVLYVFVQIAFDTSHLVETVRRNFASGTKLALAGTIQFAPAVHEVGGILREGAGKSEKMEVAEEEKEEVEEGAIVDHEVPRYDVFIPQSKPLSPGEVLGCTSPVLPAGTEAIIFVADGRFHLESLMIHNPHVQAFRYDPYKKQMTLEEYDFKAMHDMRRSAIASASGAERWGVILGTLGRQGNPEILSRLRTKIKQAGKSHFVLLLSEITPAKLELMNHAVDAWIQIACPRLSIDWGNAFSKPLLNPYEAFVALDTVPFATTYPMDFYSKDAGPWTNYYIDPEVRAAQEEEKARRKAERARKRAERAAAKTASAQTRAEKAAKTTIDI